MGQKKEPNEGTVPCLVCGSRHNWLASVLLSSSKCELGLPTDIESYREWVSEEYEIHPDDPIFDSNQIQKPQYYRKHADHLDLSK